VLEKEIGRGEFGVVMKAIGVGLPGCDPAQAVAVKVLKQGQSEGEVNAFIREGARLKELSHDNVIRLLGVCMTGEPYYIVLEYMPHGDLKTLLRQCKSGNVGLQPSHLFSFALDASRGFEYLQQLRFIHRDLAARNVLVSASFVGKIGDFGMARRMYRSEYYAATGNSLTAGTLGFVDALLSLLLMCLQRYLHGLRCRGRGCLKSRP
jgi:serine/threonine protein kinase